MKFSQGRRPCKAQLVTAYLSQMTQIYEIWERQADRYYEMKKYLDETDKKVDRVQARI